MGDFPHEFPIDLYGLPDMVPLAGAPYDAVASHADEAVELLLYQFRDKPKIEALLRALVAPYDRIENALWQILTRTIPLDNAEGTHLDLWGRILKAPRRGLDDDPYRVRLKVRILALRSNGKIEELYAILRMALGEAADVVIFEAYPATIVIDIGEPSSDTSWIYSDVVRAAKAGGVRLVLAINPAYERNAFRWGLDEGDPAPGTGWGNEDDPSVGGVWTVDAVL